MHLETLLHLSSLIHRAVNFCRTYILPAIPQIKEADSMLSAAVAVVLVAALAEAAETGMTLEKRMTRVALPSRSLQVSLVKMAGVVSAIKVTIIRNSRDGDWRRKGYESDRAARSEKEMKLLIQSI